MAYPPRVRQRVADLYRKLTKSHEVARRTGIDHVTVLVIAREHRVKIRRVGRPSRPDKDPVVRRR